MQLNSTELSEIQTTVTRRNPDVRISVFLKSVRLLNRPDIRRSVHSLYSVVIGRSVPNLEPVPNRFGTGLSEIRTVMSGYRTFGSFTLQPPVIGQSTERPITGHNRPDFRRSNPKPV